MRLFYLIVSVWFTCGLVSGTPVMGITTNRMNLSRGTGAVGIFNTDTNKERMPFVFHCEDSRYILEPPGWGAWTSNEWSEPLTSVANESLNEGVTRIYYGTNYFVWAIPSPYKQFAPGFTRTRMHIVQLDDPHNWFPGNIPLLAPIQTTVVSVVSWQARTGLVDDAQITTTGTWVQSANAAAWLGYHRHDNNSGKGTKSASFVTNLVMPGRYHVETWYYPYTNRATNVPYVIEHIAGATTVTVDQTKGTKLKWMSLGTYEFGTTGKVVIRNATSNGYVIADAVRWTEEYPAYTTPLPPQLMCR